MLDIKLLREHKEEIQRKISRKGSDSALVDQAVELDQRRRELIAKLEDNQSELNKHSKEIATFHGQQKIDAIKEASTVSEKIKQLKPELDRVNAEYRKTMLAIPNPPDDDVIDGASDKENTTHHTWGNPTEFSFNPKEYLELASDLDLIDIDRAAKVSGARFYYLKREAVLLELAIVRYAMDVLTKENFIPMITPEMVNRTTMEGGGYLPSGEDEIYKTQDDLYMIGTAEQPLAGYHMNETLEASQMPLRYAGFSSCFRREAGSYGKDVRGILRVHQFDKIEMFSYVLPEDSKKEHDYLVSLEEKLMQGLKIPYRVVNICAGDLGAPASKKFDIEAWIPSENTYRETHSCSNCTDFQSRRLNIRYKKNGKSDYLHTLNGTAFAIPRLLIALLENFQQKDGSIEIPEVLHKYTGFSKIKR